MGSHNGSIHTPHTPPPLSFYNTFNELDGVQSSRVDGRKRNLCHACWRRWQGRKSGLMTSLLNELGGVQSSRVDARKRNLCHACWRRWPGRKKRFSGLIKERLNICNAFLFKVFSKHFLKRKEMCYFLEVLLVTFLKQKIKLYIYFF
jgi:hypothetical protein